MSERLCVSAADFGDFREGGYVEAAIQKAIDHCFLNGGGEVRVPGGEYLIRAVRLRSNVTLRLMADCVLKASRDINDYFILKNDKIEPVDESELSEGPWIRNKNMGAFTDFPILGSRWHNGIIRAYKAKNVEIIGEKGSVIDGQNCYDEVGEEHYRGPHAISVICCDGVHLEGYTVINSGNWANHVMKCRNVLAEKLTCKAGHDGIHMTLCRDVIIRDCEFYTGDDCVAGFSNFNVTVLDCVLNTACSAFRMGGTNVLIHRCKIYAPAKYLFRGGLSLEEKVSGVNAPEGAHHRFNMLSLFTYYADASVDIPVQPGNIVIRDCEVDGADRFLHYNFSGNERWQASRPLESIRFFNVKAKNIAMPLTAYGSPEVPLKLEMKNVDVSFREGREDVTFMHAANFELIRLDGVRIENSKADALIKIWSEPGALEIEDLSSPVSPEKIMVKAEEPFSCKAI